MSKELVDAVLNYSNAREAVRAAPEGSTDLSQALGWAASAWSRVADALQKVTQGPSYAQETDTAGAAKCEKNDSMTPTLAPSSVCTTAVSAVGRA